MFNVFLVDDEPFILEGMYHILDWASLGLRIVGHANDGAEALAALDGADVDVLVTDISMPKMTGLELIRRLREKGSEIKILVLSGYNDFDYLKEAMHLGIENYLLKPVNPQELRESLRSTTEKLAAPAVSPWSARDIGVLRDNIMHRWMTGRIALDELQELQSREPTAALERAQQAERYATQAAHLAQPDVGGFPSTPRTIWPRFANRPIRPTSKTASGPDSPFRRAIRSGSSSSATRRGTSRCCSRCRTRRARGRSFGFSSAAWSACRRRTCASRQAA